jgi:hypothetical protein
LLQCSILTLARNDLPLPRKEEYAKKGVARRTMMIRRAVTSIGNQEVNVVC